MKNLIFTLLFTFFFFGISNAQLTYPKKNCEGAKATPDDLKSWCGPKYYNKCECEFEKAVKAYKAKKKKLENKIESLNSKISNLSNKSRKVQEKANRLANDMTKSSYKGNFNADKNTAIAKIREAVRYSEEALSIVRQRQQIHVQLRGGKIDPKSTYAKEKDLKFLKQKITEIQQLQPAIKNDETIMLSNDDDDWNSDEPLLSKSSNNPQRSTSNSQEESIYQKRQREARERKQREREHYRKQQDQVNQTIKQGEKRVNAINQAKQTWENNMQSAQDQLRREQEAERERFRRVEEKEREEYKKKQAEFNRKQALWEQQRKNEQQKIDAQRNFMNNLNDQSIPINFNQDKAYVIFVQYDHNRELKLIPGILHKTSDNHLPYKQDVLNKLKSDRRLYRVKVYGVYDNFDEFKKSANQLYATAQQNHVSIKELNRFEYGTPRENQTNENTNDKDFWGDDKSKTKKKTNDDFWNN